jgi:hypothetical protein
LETAGHSRILERAVARPGGEVRTASSLNHPNIWTMVQQIESARGLGRF